MRARPRHRRLVVDQRHGLCARPCRRLRPLGGVRAQRLVLCARAALFPPPGILAAAAPSFYRGGDGPLATQTAAFDDPLVDAFAAAGRAAGYKTTADYNGAQQEGFCTWQMTVKDGRRCSAADAYLRPALQRPNLTVEIEALATKIVFDGRRAAGVEYIQRGETVTAHAEREVILCGGVINSPQLLMLSGIGDPAELAAHGIAVKAALPGVGKNLQDHISASVAYARKEPGPFHKAMRFDRIVPALVRAYLRGEGIATGLPTGRMAFLKSRPDAALPDVQFIFNAAPMTAAPYLWPFRRRLRGRLRLPRRGAAAGEPGPARARLRRPAASAAHPPEFPRHRQRPHNAARRPAHGARGLPASSDGRRSWRARSRRATARRQTPISTRISAPISITVHHPLGTCKMGPGSDPLAVVDAELRVFGTEGLRVVDGSVMPDLVGGNINAPIIMIAEKAADLVRGRQPLEAVRLAGASEYSRQ